ncbi:MAG TPA: TRAP transporter small permease subunit [Burkholderiales bacterium]|nr:TRAP transporter small permease subunit [Burkholderiales bacterium]
MHPSLQKGLAWLHRRAENIAAGMLAVMFVAFLLQIVFRYLFNLPVGWSSELTVIMWLWLVLWGSAFVLTEKEEIRFDLIYSAVGPRARIGMAILFSLAIVILYGASLKASYAYVSFMKVEKSSYLKIPLNWLDSIYLVFLVAIIVRYVWLLSRLLRGKDPQPADLTKVSSGL